MSKYYVIVDHEGSDAFIESVMDQPTVFDTEAEAIAAAKNYSAECLVLKSTAVVTPVEKHKVTKLS